MILAVFAHENKNKYRIFIQYGSFKSVNEATNIANC